MHPILFQLGPISISSLGFFLFLAFISSSFVICREARRENLEEEKVFDIFLLTVILAFFFSRIFYIILNFSEFGFNLLNWILINAKPGFYFYGGFLLSIFFLWRISAKQKLPFRKIVDIFAYAVLVAFIFGCLGAFLDGSDVGVRTSLPWGFYMVGFEGRRHPVPLYNLFFLGVTLYLFLKVKRVYYEKNIPHGTLGLIFLFTFGLSQFTLEFFRESKVYWGRINLNQLISFLLFLVAGAWLYLCLKNLREDFRKRKRDFFQSFFGLSEKITKFLLKRRKNDNKISPKNS